MRTPEKTHKRHWTERDWEVVLEALSFVAVYADTTPVEDVAVKQNKRRGKKSKKEKKEVVAPTSRTTRTMKKKSAQAKTEEEEMQVEVEVESVSVTPVEKAEAFWLAQLQDDVTEDMLEGEARVSVTWLNKQARPDGKLLYEFAYDEFVDVQSILCHVYMRELDAMTLELTNKSADRVQRSLRRTRGELPADADDVSDGEAPPVTRRKKASLVAAVDDEEGGSRRRRSSGGGGGRRRVVSAKMSKRIAAMHIPPQYASVDLSCYSARELGNETPLESLKGDPIAGTRAVVAAVRAGDHDRLKTLTEDKTLGKSICSFSANQSVEVVRTAFQYAIAADDVNSVALLLKARSIPRSELASTPKVSLPSHSTGQHTSSYSDYNRRAINASRGGKEGNNALLEDKDMLSGRTAEDDDFFWECPSASLKMLTVLYPSGQWVQDYNISTYVASAARAGNYKLVAKLIETLSVNGGWGYNDLHVKVLSLNDDALPTFRGVSAVKQADQHKIRPLHLAATNPNSKYLQELWEIVGMEHGDVRDSRDYGVMHYAAVNESPDAVRFLLEKKCSLLPRTKDKHTPLMRSIILGREDTAIAMLEWASAESEDLVKQVTTSRGPDSHQLLHLAALHGRNKVLTHLLSMGVDVKSVATNRTTALLLAARSGHMECVETLLAHGAKVDQVDKWKKTALIYAVKNGHTHIAAFLINQGANVNVYDTSENSVAHYAASYGWLSCLELLGDAGAEVWARNSWGFVPLICAMMKQHTSCMDYILKCDTENRFMDFRDREGRTMLYLQCQHSSSVSQIKFLLEKGMSPDVADASGKFPLDVILSRYARSKSDPFFKETLRLLIKHEARVNYDPIPSENEEEDRQLVDQPLQIAIRSNLQQAFLILLTEGKADPSFVAPNRYNAWLESAALGDAGTFYLRQLLQHSTGVVDLNALYSNGDNFFHCVSSCAASGMVAADVVEQCISRCPNVDDLMNKPYTSPLMTLLKKRRSVTKHQASDEAVIADLGARDNAFCDMVRLFARLTQNLDALRMHTVISRPHPVNADETVKEHVLDYTILHVIARAEVQQLEDSTNDRSNAWYGDNVMALILEAAPATQNLVNTPVWADRKTPLLLAVDKADIETVQILLHYGADPNYSPTRCKTCASESDVCDSCSEFRPWRDTALVTAVMKEDTAMVELLLASGGSIDCCRSNDGSSLLHLAMAARNAKLTSVLLQHGASLLALNGRNLGPLLASVIAGSSVSVKKPHEGEIEYSKKRWGRGLVYEPESEPSSAQAGTSKDQTVIDVVRDHQDLSKALSAGDNRGCTAVHHAASKRDLPLLRTLLDRLQGTERSRVINSRDENGRTPLHFALNSASMSPDASFEIERYLLLSGADVRVVDNFGFSALHFALSKIDMNWHRNYDKKMDKETRAEQSQRGEYEIIKRKVFIRHINTAPAAHNDPVETVSNLIAAGCAPTVLDSFGRSPLHLAASLGAFVCLSTLMSAIPQGQRSDAIEHKDVEAITPLGRAFLNVRVTAITTLIQSGASVADNLVVDGAERSYFNHAVKHSLSGVCHMLLNAGFCRRQAVEDAIACQELQLASNLMVGLEISSDVGLLAKANDKAETYMHTLAKFNPAFDTLARDLAWKLVDGGVDVAASDQGGNTALHYAAGHANTKLMDYLLHHRANVNGVNEEGQTPLRYALQKLSQDTDKQRQVLQYCVSQPEFNVLQQDASGLNALMLFVEHFMEEFETDRALFSWMEHVVQVCASRSSGSLDELYAPTIEKDFFENDVLGSSIGARMPLVIRACYGPSSTTRCLLLYVLLKNGANLTTLDSNGNSLLKHLAAQNRLPELRLVLGKCASVTLWKEAHRPSFIPSRDELRQALRQVNPQSKTVLHVAIEPLLYGSYENTELIRLLVDSGASLNARDFECATALEYTGRQNSRVVFRFLKSKFPEIVKVDEGDVFPEAMEDTWPEAPDYASDSATYLKQCEATGKIRQEWREPHVARNCDVGRDSRVFGVLDSNGRVVEGEEYDALLTKVDVKNGRFGVNVFYRLQLVHDAIQDIYIVFTNWGRIGEEGKYQNTPFRKADEAVTEFKKIFRSKTNNAWEDRRDFEKKRGKYLLLRHTQHDTYIDPSVTKPFSAYRFKQGKQASEDKEYIPQFASLPGGIDAAVTELLFAISDVRNLQLAAAERCQYRTDLPLAKDEDLREAMEMLHEVLSVLKERQSVQEEIDALSANITEEVTTSLSELSDKFATLTELISEQSSRYYEVVPCNENRNGGPIRAFDSALSVEKEMYRLKQLLDITHTYKMLLGAKHRQEIVHPTQYVHDALQIRVDRLSEESHEHALLLKYFFNGVRKQNPKQYRISNIFEVARRGESDRFESYVQSKPSLREQHSKLLWHGTSRTNLMGILADGLRIAPPEAPHHGYSYGKGLYFADVSAKSLPYCGSPYEIEIQQTEEDKERAEKRTKRQVYYMLLCDVALGTQLNVNSTSFERPDDVDSVLAVGQHAPDPQSAIVSPMCGSQVPVGKIGRLGIDYPTPLAWGTKATGTSSSSLLALSSNAQLYLDRIVDAGDIVPGTRISVDNEKLSDFAARWESLKTVEIEVLTVAEAGSVGNTSDVSLRLKVEPTNTWRSSEEYEVRRFRDVFVSSVNDAAGMAKTEGFDLVTHHSSHSGQEYNEHVVYHTSQARIRYLVEVELQGNTPTWF
ncbi:hypothetical protein Poli38472_007709 [Pythium oligandrum]|uniref:Poly [ADP-ribose] polymerase n=1 Tax=Pythium oligandrum TaxID=41045 RepID=A0A8K1CSN7_PYTOL|nr:hypothetical protein Poli38472_007709 [Pythium oligandrum]|eukprot:TMW68037.1 hypothetical protein Poli38472_007709 [Pythium oligandrum]